MRVLVVVVFERRYNFFVHGMVPNKKQREERERQVAAGKVHANFAPKELRGVGMLRCKY